MTFDGGALSDDEANSWDEDVSDGSDGSEHGYYDEEDEDEEGSPSPRKNDNDEKEEKAADGDAIEEDEEQGRLCMNVYCTEYEIIRKVARKVLGFKLREYHEDHDGAVRKGQHN